MTGAWLNADSIEDGRRIPWMEDLDTIGARMLIGSLSRHHDHRVTNSIETGWPQAVPEAAIAHDTRRSGRQRCSRLGIDDSDDDGRHDVGGAIGPASQEVAAGEEGEAYSRCAAVPRQAEGQIAHGGRPEKEERKLAELRAKAPLNTVSAPLTPLSQLYSFPVQHTGAPMAIKTSCSHARENLATLWDEVEDSREAAVIQRRGRTKSPDVAALRRELGVAS